MSDSHTSDQPANAPAPAQAEFDLGEAYDLPLSDAPRAGAPPPRWKPPPAVRAALFFLVATAIGTGVGQSIGLIISLFLVSGPSILGDPAGLQAAILRLGSQPTPLFLIGLTSFLATLGITTLFLVVWDRRPLRTAGFQLTAADGGGVGALGQFVGGLALGGVLMVGIFVVEVKLGWLQAAQVLPTSRIYGHAALWFVALLPLAAQEELLLRGYTFQALEEQWGGITATVLTALVFAALHSWNPNATRISFIGIFVSGVLFGVAYLTTRRLWLPIGLHVAWNLVEGPLLGFPVSGIPLPSVIATTLRGPALWTGGPFGPEAGLLSILASLVGAGLLLARRRRNGS